MNHHTVLADVLRTASETGRGVTFIEARNEETRLSYASLLNRAQKLLGLLQARGMSAGDELILLLKDNRSFVEMFWACILGGIVPVPVATGISDEHRAKLFRIFSKLQRPWLYTEQDALTRLDNFATNHGMMAELAALQARTLKLEDLAETDGPVGEPHTARPGDTAFIQFSSGSTSDPKGVVLTHANILTNIRGIIEAGRFSDKDISLSWMPLTHDMGLIGFHLNMLACLMDQYLMPAELFSRRPLLWLQKASEKRASILCSPNFGYKHYLKALGDKPLDQLDLSCVRLIYNGAEPISIPLCNEFLARLLPVGLAQESMYPVYGLAEASLAVTFPPAGKVFRAICVRRDCLGMGEIVQLVSPGSPDAVSFAIEGVPVPGCDVRIADEHSLAVAEDTIGAIQIRGENVTAGYYRDEISNATALVGDGWLDTGDMGFLHQGELVVTGRRKDIIFAHGINYYPHDLEAIALQSSRLELGKVVVYGVRRDNAEEDELLVFILYRAEQADFLPLVREVSHLINEQTGLEVNHVIPVKRIPKTTSGKVQRRLLGDAYLQGEYDSVITELTRLHDAAQSASNGAMSEMEAKLKAIVDQVVTDKHLGIHENFFDAGISSLALAEIHQYIDDTWPEQVDITDLFEYQTIADVADFLDTKLTG
jgi:acyl-CoA synthetase (AMP-forming)/AMP-acid ligase II/acyl carrier protein